MSLSFSKWRVNTLKRPVFSRTHPHEPRRQSQMFFVVLGFVVQVADSSFKLDPQISLLPQLQNNHLPLFYELAHLAMLML
jgi:hypothetical protein